MGAGKSTVGRRLAARLRLPFVDADSEIEAAAGMSIAEIFERFGEAHFRDGERRVIARLIDGTPKVIATGGGAFINDETRALILKQALSIWLDANPAVLADRVGRRDTRPLLRNRDPRAVLDELAKVRNPIYALAHIRVPSHHAPHESTVNSILKALRLSTSITVSLGARSHEVVIEDGLLARAGERLAPLSRGRTMAIVTDENVLPHLATLQASLAEAGVASEAIVLAPGEGSKSWATLEQLTDRLLDLGVERGDHVIALGGGVIGDLVGFATAIVKRGCGFVQIPTTLLAQVDSSVGGKTAINARAGKNLDRRLSSACRGADRPAGARHAAAAPGPCRLCRGREIRA